MEEKLIKRDKALNHLNQIIVTQSRLAQANFDVDNFMNLVVEQVQSLTSATGVVVELVEGDDMVYRAATGAVKDHVGMHLKREGSISGLCVAQQEILRSNDTEQDPRVNREACRKVKARSMVVAPLFHEGAAVGVLKILSSAPNAFDEDDVQTLQLMASLIGSALAHRMYHDTTQKLLTERTEALEELKKAEEKLKHMATYDFLTDLPNRALLIDRLNVALLNAKRHQTKIALLFLDIDHFKSINDNLGHDIGDELLKGFASRIKQCVRATDTPARLGGDEFVILLNELTDNDIPVAIAKKLIARVTEPFVFQGKTVNISTSIGIAFYNQQKTPDELLKQADEALYEAKQAGRNQYKIFKQG